MHVRRGEWGRLQLCRCTLTWRGHHCFLHNCSTPFSYRLQGGPEPVCSEKSTSGGAEHHLVTVTLKCSVTTHELFMSLVPDSSGGSWCWKWAIQKAKLRSNVTENISQSLKCWEQEDFLRWCERVGPQRKEGRKWLWRKVSVITLFLHGENTISHGKGQESVFGQVTAWKCLYLTLTI